MKIEQRLEVLGVQLPEPVGALANYLTTVQHPTLQTNRRSSTAHPTFSLRYLAIKADMLVPQSARCNFLGGLLL